MQPLVSFEQAPQFQLEMITETQFVRFDSISLDSGATLAPVDVAYETYGDSERCQKQRHPGSACLFRRCACRRNR